MRGSRTEGVAEAERRAVDHPPEGARAEISERATMAAGKAAGLVDVKVVGFSPTHTAEKFVIPLLNRRRHVVRSVV